MISPTAFPNIARMIVVALASTIALLMPYSTCAGDEPAHFIIHGNYYNYGVTGPSSPFDTFGPAEGSFGTSYSFPGNTTSRNIHCNIDLNSTQGILYVELLNSALLRAREIDGNDFGGGFDAVADVYVQGPPGTPFYLDKLLAGSAHVVRGEGAGTTQAFTAGATAVVDNGTGSDIEPVSIQTGREYLGITSFNPHPTLAGYQYATSVTVPMWGFTYQGISFCFTCPVFDYQSTSLLSGTISAGPCCPQTADIDNWNNPENFTSAEDFVQQRINRCFNYALNRKSINGQTKHPGDLNPGSWSCELLDEALENGDGLVGVDDPESCAIGSCVIAVERHIIPSHLFASDYHFYRRNADGSWSHKRNGGAADTIDEADPSDHSKTWCFFNWSCFNPLVEFCGYYCVPCDYEISTSSRASESGTADNRPLVASIGMFSGLPNPEWEITDPSIIDNLRALLLGGNPVSELIERDSFGYSGMMLISDGSIAGIPRYVRALDGIVEVIDVDGVTYHTDIMGLESFLANLATDEGYGDFLTGPTTGISEQHDLMTAEQAIDAFPSPFNSRTSVKFVATRGSLANVTVYDTRGRSVATLFDGVATGLEQVITWTPDSLPSGVYFLSMRTDKEVSTIKVALLK